MTLLILIFTQPEHIPSHSISIKHHHSVGVLADMAPLPDSSPPSLLLQTDLELHALQMCPDADRPKKGRQERRTAGMWKRRQEEGGEGG